MNTAAKKENAMSIIRLVQVGATTLQAVIEAVQRFGADPDTLGTRLSVAQLLYLQLDGITADAEEEPLLAAYRDWLSVASRYFGPTAQATEREYSRSAAILLAELRLAGVAASASARADADGGSLAADDFALTNVPPQG